MNELDSGSLVPVDDEAPVRPVDLNNAIAHAQRTQQPREPTRGTRNSGG